MVDVQYYMNFTGIGPSDSQFLKVIFCLWKKVLVAQSCPTLCNPMNCSLPGFSAREILQARLLGWIAIPFSKGSSRPRDQTQVSHIAGRFFTIWVTKEVHLPLLLSHFSHVRLCAALQPARLLCPWDSPGESSRVGCRALLQEIFPTQGSNSGLLCCRQIPYHWAYREAQAHI